MKYKINEFLENKEKYISPMAKEIADIFQNEANNENIDYSFSINRKTGQIYNNESANTYFMFDTKSDTLLDRFKKALFDEDLENIEEKKIEENKLMSSVTEFLTLVCQEITLKHHNIIKETIRRVILGGRTQEDVTPLKTIKVLSIDIADYTSIPESGKYLLKIGKKPDSEINTDEVVKFIQNRQEKTGMDINSVFSIEKKAGNPMFENIISIERSRKFLNEITIYFFIDYSINFDCDNDKSGDKKLESENKI